MNLKQKLTCLTRWFLFGNQIVDAGNAMHEGKPPAFQDESNAKKDGYLQYVSNGMRVRVDLDDGKTINVGNSFDTDCYIDSPNLSKNHANFKRDGNQYFVEVPKDSDGETLVDGKKVDQGGSEKLRDGSVISLGGYVVRFYRRPSISDGLMKYAGTEG